MNIIKLTQDCISESDISILKDNKINFLVMDDSEAATTVLLMDLNILSKLHYILKGEQKSFKVHDELLDTLTEEEKEFIKNNDVLSLVTVVISTTTEAAFIVIKNLDILIKNNIKIDIAILDLVLGGTGLYHGETQCITGVTAAYELLNYFNNLDFIFYTGCYLDENSNESQEYKILFNKDIYGKVIYKNNDFLIKRKKILNMIMSCYNGVK